VSHREETEGRLLRRPLSERYHDGLQFAKPNLQSVFKKTGYNVSGPGVRRAAAPNIRPVKPESGSGGGGDADVGRLEACGRRDGDDPRVAGAIAVPEARI
jgi:hypothetical protein